MLTDGAVHNVGEIVAEIKKNNKDNLRVHTFGIGSGVSTALIQECAKAGNGMYYFIDRKEEIENKVIEALSVNSLPYLNIKKIEFLDS